MLPVQYVFPGLKANEERRKQDMMHVHKSLHQFVKVNPSPLIDDMGFYDEYRCQNCGLTGKSTHDSEFIEIEGRNTSCAATKEYGRVKLTSGPHISLFGLPGGGELIDTVPCPKEWDHKYNDAVWVYSPVRNEPVRLIHGEYQIAY
ncbi:hypothetical protein [uncultured Mucilaginibacter sp.]|uniref:hypothetical protein n=1 Tax=uncultured Mucilaginibacter sp. TaxID=797541 RepID=UPI0025F2F65B|nr:hypothetical protein [uncultured Mucilaginibacter sp.]